MSDHHFFVEPADIEDGILTVRGDEAHHAARVLRVRPGESITAADGTGAFVKAVVRDVGDVVVADIHAERHVNPLLPSITLFQALGKSDKLDVVVEKATEVGVQRIAPFVAQRSIVRWDERKLTRAHERWSAIARSAAKQSRAARIPIVDAVSDGVPSVASFVLHEAATMRLRDALPSDAPEELSIVVGPEGGLTENEVASIDGAAVSLGPRVLRTETAGPVAAAVIGFRYGWFG